MSSQRKWKVLIVIPLALALGVTAHILLGLRAEADAPSSGAGKKVAERGLESMLKDGKAYFVFGTDGKQTADKQQMAWYLPKGHKGGVGGNFALIGFELTASFYCSDPARCKPCMPDPVADCPVPPIPFPWPLPPVPGIRN